MNTSLHTLKTKQKQKNPKNKLHNLNVPQPPSSLMIKGKFNSPCSKQSNDEVNTMREADKKTESSPSAQTEGHKFRKTLVLDLDETLVHSTYQQITDVHITINVRLMIIALGGR